MSDAFYKDLQDTVSDLLPQFKQGTVLLRRFHRGVDPSPSKVGEVVNTSEWELAAAIPKETPKKYLNGTTIVEGDLLVVCAVRALSPVEIIDPQMDDAIVVGGAQKTIKAIKQVPLTGVPVSFLIFIQG